MPDNDTRLALIGAGRWGRVYIKTIEEVSGVLLKCVASSNPEIKNHAPTGCEVVSDWRQILSQGGIDGVIIATPPDTHFEIAEKFIEVGLPVLIEKPLTMDVGEAENLLALAERRDAIVMVDHTHLYHPAYRKLKEHGAQLGPARTIKSLAGNSGPVRAYTPLLWDWGAHDIAMCLDLIGEQPIVATAEIKTVKRTGEEDGESAAISLTFPSGAVADIEISNAFENRTRIFEVGYQNQSLIYDGVGPSALTFVRDADDVGTRIEVGSELPLNIVVREFAGRVRSRSRQLDDLTLGVNIVRVLESLLKSSEVN